MPALSSGITSSMVSGLRPPNPAVDAGFARQCESYTRHGHASIKNSRASLHNSGLGLSWCKKVANPSPDTGQNKARGPRFAP